MKKIVFFTAVFAATTCFGAMVERDMMELRLQGNMDFNNPRGKVETDLNIGLGYFIEDDIQIGGLIAFENDGSEAGFGFGAYSEIMFDLNYAAAPFAGASLQFRFGEIYTDNYLLLDLTCGVRVFLTEYMAISGMFYFDLATENVYVNNRKSQNHDSGLRLGLNVYF